MAWKRNGNNGEILFISSFHPGYVSYCPVSTENDDVVHIVYDEYTGIATAVEFRMKRVELRSVLLRTTAQGSEILNILPHKNSRSGKYLPPSQNKMG